MLNSTIHNIRCKNAKPMTLFNPLCGFMYERNNMDDPLVYDQMMVYMTTQSPQ